MKNIVKIEKGLEVVSIKDIAKYSGVSERAIVETIRENKKEFDNFGTLRLDKELSHMQQHLNEAETYFLLTLMKNTENVKKFKVELITQFFTMRDRLEEKQSKALSIKDKQIKMLSETVYAKPRNNGLESVTRIVKDYNIDMTPHDLNILLTSKGMLRVEDIVQELYTSNNMSHGTALVHVDSVLQIIDEFEIDRGVGFADKYPRLDFGV